MYTEDWIIAHRRCVWLGAVWGTGDRTGDRRWPLNPGEPSGGGGGRRPVLLLICPPALHGQAEFCRDAQAGRMGCQASRGACGGVRPPRGSPGSPRPRSHPAPPPPRYQHLSAAYSPITTETQRERQRGLSRQVFEQDASGDEKASPEDAVRDPGGVPQPQGRRGRRCRGSTSQSQVARKDPNSLEPKRQ